LLVESCEISGIDVLVRDVAEIPVTRYDGRTIPFGDDSFDTVLLIDVLHHTGDAAALLAEAARVARGCVIVKDHLCESRMDGWLLSFMDWVGNRPHGVSLEYNYLSAADWDDCIASAGLVKQGRAMSLARDLDTIQSPNNPAPVRHTMCYQSHYPIGSLDAVVKLVLPESIHTQLNNDFAELKFIFIVSKVEVVDSLENESGVTESEVLEGLQIFPQPMGGQKCERCWNFSTFVGKDSEHPKLCKRCLCAVKEIQHAR